MAEEAKEIKMDFTVFMSSILMEGLAALGLVKHPATEKIEKDLRHAGIVIDTLDMLKEKTAGNLTGEESKSLEEALHQLRMAYLAILDREGKKDEK